MNKSNSRDELFTLLISFVLVVFVFMGTIIYLAIKFPIENGNQTQPQVQEVLFYKTIPVVITDIDKEFYNVKSHAFSVSVKVKTDEYGIEKKFTLQGGMMGGDTYANDAYTGKLKIGDVINAELYSWKQGETVTRRELNRLIK